MDNILALENMILEKEGAKAWLTFTRESRLNAMNNAATFELNQAARTLQEDMEVRVVVIRGQGRAFSTGLDLKEYARGEIDMSYHHRWEGALRLFETIEKIVIVGMHGYCLGGALQLALAGDIRVSTANCRIGLPAIKESLIPGLSVWRLPRYIGMGRARKLVLGGENLSGEEALKIGLVDHLVPEVEFFAHLDRVAEDYLAACSTGTRMSKLLLNSAFDRDYDAILEEYFLLQERAQYSPDAEEARRAYLARRQPKWE